MLGTSRSFAAALALAALGCSSALAISRSAPVVHVPHRPSPVGGVAISFTPREALPAGGYYYAVAVLTKHYAKRLFSKRCAQASDMQYTEYGYPGPGKPVRLTLSPEKIELPSGTSTLLDWCPGTAYRGAVYAIPHSKPCRRPEPCHGHSTAPECYPGEPLCNNGKQGHGKVAGPRPLKPGQLPSPRDTSARTVAYFRVRFTSERR